MQKNLLNSFSHCVKEITLTISSLLFLSLITRAEVITPTLTIRANYCDFPGKVRVTATSNMNVATWTWNFGLVGVNTATSSYIDVDNAGTFSVSAHFVENDYTASISMKVAQELVVNGDFEMGNTAFTSDYSPVANTVMQGLQPEGTYAVHNSPNFMHNYFFGKDHTTATGTGKFMLVNGTSDKIIWKQTLSVVPGETYYFSAYAVSLNDVAPFSNLKFQVNGVQVGSPTGVLPSKSPDSNGGTWIRFYGKWNSEAATIAEIKIIDLENAANGNDFGLDDISFGTLSPFLNLTSGAGTDQQMLMCTNSPITNITYEIGSDGNMPILTNIPAGLSTAWDGRTVTISGTPAVSGIFNYSINGTGCNTKTLPGTISIDSASVAGILPAITAACINGAGTITLTNKVGQVTKWLTSGDEGGTWSNVANTSSTVNFSNITHTVLYKAIVKNNNCKADTSAITKVGVHNLWSGGQSADWNDNKNWSDEALPTTVFCDTIIIPQVMSQSYPVLGAGITSVKNLKVLTGAFLTLPLGSTLQISGSITDNGRINASAGTVEMNGAAVQIIPANIFVNNAVKNLMISNPSPAGVILGGALDIYGSLTYSATGMKLITNDHLTIKSTASNTAWVGDMTGKTILGEVTVERYISARKAWRFLSIPTNTAQSVKQTWQEGCGLNLSCVSGFGTQITGAGGTAAGFDIYTATPSMKTYNPATNAWVGIANTSAVIKSTEGYMTFVRGDRNALTFNSTPTATVLRTKGDLFTGNLAPIAVGGLKFASIGNPYASALDMRNISTTGIKEFFYVWDPNLSGTLGLGAYQTFSYNGSNYEVTPGLGSYGASGSINNYIQSGLAFFVQGTTAGGSLTFTEASKANGSNPVSRPAAPGHQLRVNLYGIISDTSAYMADGVLINYDATYSNEVDDLDAIKSLNTSENLSIKTANRLLVIERRQNITERDTVVLNLGNVKAQKYRFEVIANYPDERGMVAFLEDSYLHTKTPLSLEGKTTVNFTIVNIPGAYAANRFTIVFSVAKVLPLTFTNVKAYVKNNAISVEWETGNESNMKQYEVEKSIDGSNYSKATAVAARNKALNNYSWVDADAAEGYNYYRIKSMDINGKAEFSKVVKVYVSTQKQSITVYPNPVKDGIINLQLNNQLKGEYGMRVINKMGQVIISKHVHHEEGSSSKTIQLDKYSAYGIYQLEITKPDGSMVNINVSILK